MDLAAGLTQGRTQGGCVLDLALLPAARASVLLPCASIYFLVCQRRGTEPAPRDCGSVVTCGRTRWRSQSVGALGLGQDWAALTVLLLSPSVSSGLFLPVLCPLVADPLCPQVGTGPLGEAPVLSKLPHRRLSGELCKRTLPQDAALVAPNPSSRDVWGWAPDGLGRWRDLVRRRQSGRLLASRKELPVLSWEGRLAMPATGTLATPELQSPDLLKVTGIHMPWLLCGVSLV